MAIYKEGCTDRAVVIEIQKAVGAYPDGKWGRLTTEAVKAWQKAHSLTPDGIVGPKTLAAMASQQPVLGKDGVVLSFPGGSIRLRKSRRRIDEIIVHCTADPEGRDKTVEQIRAGHMAPVSKGGRGYSDIGYHYIIYRDGSIHEGRNVDVSGAHCTNHNARSVGVVYVGGLENRPGVPYDKLQPKDTRTDAQRESLIALLQALRLLYPTAKIYGHRNFAKKACPSFDAKKEYSTI